MDLNFIGDNFNQWSLWYTGAGITFVYLAWQAFHSAFGSGSANDTSVGTKIFLGLLIAVPGALILWPVLWLVGLSRLFGSDLL